MSDCYDVCSLGGTSFYYACQSFSTGVERAQVSVSHSEILKRMLKDKECKYLD